MGGPLSQVSIGTQAISSGNLAAFGSAFFTSRVSADTGSTILGGARRGGAVVLATDRTDNDENQAVFTGGKCIGAFAAGQTGRFVARIKGTEGNTNDQDWYIGFADVADTADFFTDSDAFAAAVDGIGFYKLKDSMFFRTAALNASTNSAVGFMRDRSSNVTMPRVTSFSRSSTLKKAKMPTSSSTRMTPTTGELRPSFVMPAIGA